MDLLTIKINDTISDYIDSIEISGKNYIAYGDGEAIYISGFNKKDGSLYPISDEEFNNARKAMKLDV